jgi:hypothetical protein
MNEGINMTICVAYFLVFAIVGRSHERSVQTLQIVVSS